MKSVDEKKPLPPVKLLQEIISAFIVLSSVLFLFRELFIDEQCKDLCQGGGYLC